MSPRSNESHSATSFHQFTRAMWFEFKIAADYSTGMSEATRGTTNPPGGFVRNELGFGIDSADKCSPGCRCTPLRRTKYAGKRTKSPRSGKDWQNLVAGAVAAARQAA